MHIFWAVQGLVQIKNFNVKGKESCMWGGESGIEEELGGCEVCNSRADIPGVLNVVSTHGETNTVGFCFLGVIVNNNPPISCSLAGWNIMLVNELNGISTR